MVISDNSIVADKITIQDLTSLDADIAGVHMSMNNYTEIGTLYTTGKTSVNSTASGFYLDSSVQMNVGGENSFIKFYKEGNTWKVKIAADAISMGGSPIPNPEDIPIIDDIENWYLATSESGGVTKNTSGWTTSVQSMTQQNQYLWNYEVVKDASGNTISSSDPVIIGRYGTNGDPGRGISLITNYYLASSSSSGVTRSTQGWTPTVQSTDNDHRYLWNYEKIEYTTGDPDYTDCRIIGTHGVRGEDTSSAYMTFYPTDQDGGGTGSKGLFVHTSSSAYPLNVNAYGVQIDTSEIKIRKGGKVVASYGDVAKIGYLTPSSQLYDWDDYSLQAQIDGSSFNLVGNTNDASNVGILSIYPYLQDEQIWYDSDYFGADAEHHFVGGLTVTGDMGAQSLTADGGRVYANYLLSDGGNTESSRTIVGYNGTNNIIGNSNKRTSILGSTIATGTGLSVGGALAVDGNITTDGYMLSSYLRASYTNSNQYGINLQNDSSGNGRAATVGYVINKTSDQRLKDDISEIDSYAYIDLYNDLVPKRFQYKEARIECIEDRRIRYGFVAQDIEYLLNKNNVPDNGLIFETNMPSDSPVGRLTNGKPKNFDYDSMHALHVLYNHHLNERIIELENEVSYLKEVLGY